MGETGHVRIPQIADDYQLLLESRVIVNRAAAESDHALRPIFLALGRRP
jgi:hypothetical protein